ncbi:hypothetical protein GCM10022238_39480 [Gordonia hankookensis]
MNTIREKTEVFEGEDVAGHALQAAHSVIDDALNFDKDQKPLEKLMIGCWKILVKQLGQGSSVRGRMRRQKCGYRTGDSCNLAERMPYAADYLARTLVTQFPKGELEEWLVPGLRGRSVGVLRMGDRPPWALSPVDPLVRDAHGLVSRPNSTAIRLWLAYDLSAREGM